MLDLIIIGGGPAGLTAAIYAARYKLDVLLMTQFIGGMATKAHRIENYPGFDSISGVDLLDRFAGQAKRLGTDIVLEDVKKAIRHDGAFLVNDQYSAKAIILALGTEKRKLNIPGEDSFIGRGVSYCAVCDAPFFKNKTVAVVGGSDAAASAAVHLSGFASKVFIIYRKDSLRAEPAWIEQIAANPLIEVIYNSNVSEINGDKMVESVALDSGEIIMIDGVFIEAGSLPSTSLAIALKVQLDDKKYIKVDPNQRTNIRKVYAAGDITDASGGMKQIVTAAAQGAIAARSAYEDLMMN